MAKDYLDSIVDDDPDDVDAVEDQSNYTKELKADIIDAIDNGSKSKEEIVDEVDTAEPMVEEALKDLRSEGVLELVVDG